MLNEGDGQIGELIYSIIETKCGKQHKQLILYRTRPSNDKLGNFLIRVSVS